MSRKKRAKRGAGATAIQRAWAWQPLLIAALAIVVGGVAYHFGSNRGPASAPAAPEPTQPSKSLKLAADLVSLLEGQLKTPSSKRASVVEQVRELLADGADPNHYPAQLSALAYALLLHDTSTALLLLEGGADPDAPVASKGLRMAGISAAQESAIKDNMRPLHLCTS